MSNPLATYPRGTLTLRNEVSESWKKYGGVLEQSYDDNIRAAGELVTVDRAELIWVSEDMCQLLDAAARTLPRTTKLAVDDLPADFGFVVLAKPLKGFDSRRDDDRLLVRAF